MPTHSCEPKRGDAAASWPRATTVTTTFDGAGAFTIIPVRSLSVLGSTDPMSE